MLPLHFLQSEKFLNILSGKEKYEVLGVSPKLGRRIKLFNLIAIDVYVCEEEPGIQSCRGLRIISWHVPKNKDIFEKIKKPGWIGPFGKYLPVTNPVPYINANTPEYFKLWAKRKREHRNIWLRSLEEKKLEIIESDLATFLQHYLNSDLSKRVKDFNQKQMKTISEIYKKDMFFYLVKDSLSEKIIAGVCILHDNELNQAIYQYCFSDKNYKHVGVGIIDLCVVYARENKLKYVNLTPINIRGHETKSWRGFTKFKLLFNPIVIYFRQSYFKITFNW